MKQKGFTIVELLIVIVIIGILAAITVVAYNGIQNRANDAAVQSNLDAIGKQIRLHYAREGVFPKGFADLNDTTKIQIKATKAAYGNHMISGGLNYNLLYCWPNAAAPESFALIASSKSGKVFQYKNGVSEASYSFTGGSIAICTSAGNTMDTGSERDFFYDANNWRTYVKD
ncbi:MAG: prepilin-type N-terminal cleavage/methylation domain-containing protein [Candidatus Saccharimonadales bacterium]